MPFSPKFDGDYDVVVVGTGFAATFFLQGYLRRARSSARVLVLERGARWDHATQVEHRRASEITAESTHRRTGDPEKQWMYTLGFGGGSNCWWSNAPRFLPSDFRTKSLFGVGEDWPLGYEDLEPYYDEVEVAMALSGPDAPWPYPRKAGYLHPPHRFNAPETLLKKAYPDSFFAVPNGRARSASGNRGGCCGNGVCHLCPVNAKWSIENSFSQVYDDPRVTVVLKAEVLAVETAGGRAKGVRLSHDGGERIVSADLVVLCANAIFNPVILQRSGLNHPLLGRRLHEQVGLTADVFLDGLDSFQGSTSVTGHSYALYTDTVRRKQMAACLLETWNIGLLRTETGRWTQVLPVRMVFEVIPEERNFVRFDSGDPQRPVLHYEGHSDYTERAIGRAHADLERLMAPLPVERIVVRADIEKTEAHILGTTPMGVAPARSIVDRDGMHHQLRNLLVLGGSTFPVSGPANPSLTIAALALRTGDRLEASQ